MQWWKRKSCGIFDEKCELLFYFTNKPFICSINQMHAQKTIDWLRYNLMELTLGFSAF